MRYFSLILALCACGSACAALAQSDLPSDPVVLTGAAEPEDKPAPMEAAPQAEKAAEKIVTAGGHAAFTERSEDDLVLVEVRLGREMLADSMSGYSNKGSLVLPLGQLAQLLQFPIDVSTRDGQANGWFLERTNRFSLDMSRHEIIIAGNRESFDPKLVELHKDDIYVDTTLLSHWFPLQFAFSFSNQTVSISTRGNILLPSEQENARDKLHNTLGAHRDADDKLPLPKEYFPYKLYSMPFADITFTSGLRQEGASGYSNDLNILANNDLLYMHSSLYVDADANHHLNDLRWTLSRRNPDGHLFSDGEANGNSLAQAINNIGLKEFAVGDIYTDQTQLTAFNQQGRGVMFSTMPYDRATQFDRTTLQGDLPTGWEVELYRNDELLDFQRASANGRYEFINVPLISGLNILKLVFYGPFGQKREETQRFLVSPNISEQGKGYFKVSLTQQDKGLFDLKNDTSLVVAPGITATQQDLARGAPRLLMEYEYGLLPNLSLFTNVSHLTTGDGIARNYSDVGAATSLAGVYTRLDAAEDYASQGHALELDLEDNLFGISLTGEQQQFYNGFISDFTQSTDDPLTSLTTLRADSPIDLSWLPHVNTGVTGLRELYTSGRTHYELGDRWSTAIANIAISHTLSLIKDKMPDSPAETQTQGNLILSTPVDGFLLRSNIQYLMSPDISLSGIQLTSDYYIDRDTLARLEVDRDMTGNILPSSTSALPDSSFTSNPALTTYAISLNHKFEKFLLGANASHSTNGDNAIGFTLSLSIGEEPRGGTTQIYPDYTAKDGLVSARVFHDNNNNGIFDAGDAPVENAKFRVNNGGSDTATNGDGIVLLRNVPADVHDRVVLDTNSLENPYLAPAKPGAEVVPRAGVSGIVDIPLVSTSDVEGTVYIISNGAKKPAANVDIEAVDKDGKVIKESRSAFDGYYLLDMLPVGAYNVRISPEQAERLNLRAETVDITVDGKSDTIRPVNFTVRR